MNSSILFFDATTKLINPQDKCFIGENTRELIFNEDTLIDEVLTIIINDNLLEEEYTNIILPACFGAILSNFIGLRLATQIRCTPGVNQTSNIFLYSFTGIQDYFNNECFNILKTTGVSLIDYDIQTILNCFNKHKRILTPNNLKQQVSNLKLDVPLNYADSHSVANEWAIYRWANALNTTDDQILKIETKLENDLYFKYLKTINPFNELEEIYLKELKLNFTGDPRVLYIDDEAEKGWWEIFCKILDDENEISFSHLDDEFNQKNQDEIIDISIKKVVEEKIDIVILDLRLHKKDFYNKPIDEITGFKILQTIKNYNEGIQVIIFSATNKISNLQALQNAGADGFIVKESPSNNYEPGFTRQSIENMVAVLNYTLNRKFLKKMHINCNHINQLLLNCDYVDDTPFEGFINDLKKHIKLIKLSLKNVNLADTMTLDIIFLNCYNFIEKFNKYYITYTDYQYLIGIDEVELKRYYSDPKVASHDGRFIPKDRYDKPSWFQCVMGIYVDYFGNFNFKSSIINIIYSTKQSRNNYIHNKKEKFTLKELTKIFDLMIVLTTKMKE